MNGISRNGRAVGWRQNNGAYITYIPDYNGPSTSGSIWSCRGLDGTTSGQAWCVSSNGTVIFGISPKGAATGGTNFGFKATFNSTFPGAATQLTTNMLPNFADTTGVTNLAIPYGCTADGKYAVGMSYRGAEKAVLWDTSNADTNLWTITDLTDLAIANGLTGELTNLTRAYSIGIDATGKKVIAGAGIDTNGYTRGFVLTVGQITPPLVAAHITSIVNGTSTCTINYTGGSGSQFVLLSAPTVTTSMPSWSRIATNFTGSGSFTPTKSGTQQFYRIKSE